MSRSKLASAVLAATALLGACSSSGPSSTGRTVNFQLATMRQPAAAPAGAALVSQTLTSGADVIDVSSVQLVLRKIELELATATPNCTATPTPDDDCEEIELSPRLYDVPLGPGADVVLTATDVAVGDYKSVKIEIHKPSGTEIPGFDGVSIRVIGTLNGNPFTYDSQLDVEQEFQFVTPKSITETQGLDITMLADLTSWFEKSPGGGFYDLTALSTGDHDTVENQIKSSFRVFEDDDQNGGDDDSGN